MLKQQIEQDLKAALLSGDKDRATTLRGLKSVILYAEVAKGVREPGLPDNEIVGLLSKEAKKRQESAELYVKGGSRERADAELAEKAIIEVYLPKQLTEAELEALVDEVVAQSGARSAQAMGQVIAAVKEKAATADGATIARLVKGKLHAE